MPVNTVVPLNGQGVDALTVITILSQYSVADEP